MDLTMLGIVAGLLCGVLSLTALHYVRTLPFSVPSGTRLVPVVAIGVGLLSAMFLRDTSEAVLFLAAATAQFFAFVFVSRLRQRGSYFWHAVAALGSNGTWFITVHILAEALDAEHIYPLLVVPYLAGIVAGRLVGAQWAQFVEQMYGLVADATRDPNIAPGRRLAFIVREPMFWLLSGGLVAYLVYGLATFSVGMRMALLVIIGLGLLQNFFSAVDSRARSRGSRGYATMASVAGGAVFFVTATYLFGEGVPTALFVPYVFSTTLGSTLGAFFSMIVEWTARIAPDTHVANPENAQEGSAWQGRFVVGLLLGVSVAWFFLNESVLAFFGQPTTVLILPFPIPGVETFPRELVMLTIVPVFFLKNALHSVTSRAASRNHAGYHAVACLMTGVFDFFVLSYLALNTSIVDVIPIAVLVGTLGTLFAMRVGEVVEKRLKAVMDVDLAPSRA